VLVNLKKRVKTGGRWTFLPVPRKSGRLFPEKVTEPGTFYIEWRQAGKRHQERVGQNPRAALEALRIKQNDLDDAKAVAAETVNKAGPTVGAACDQFLAHTKATKSAGTARSYVSQVNWFKKHATKTHISEIDRNDLVVLFAKGREEGLNQKTVNKRVMITLGVIRNAGFDVKLNKGDWPKTSDAEPEMYDDTDLKKFFDACDERERVLFSVFLYTGFRRMEVATLQWSGDIDWKQNVLKVRDKPGLGFTPKTYEWRSVRVPQALMKMLEKWKKQSKTDLVFPSRPHPNGVWGGDRIDGKLLEQCKEIAYRAGLNCKQCVTLQGRCKDGPHCERWFCHKFRHTFANSMLRSGVDIRSLQALLGHKSLATTEIYLRSLRLSDMENKIENSTLSHLLH
jgi:integrase/recombinase XerD